MNQPSDAITRSATVPGDRLMRGHRSRGCQVDYWLKERREWWDATRV
jgi:hypothetical protein